MDGGLKSSSGLSLSEKNETRRRKSTIDPVLLHDSTENENERLSTGASGRRHSRSESSGILNKSLGLAEPLWKQLAHKVYFVQNISAKLPEESGISTRRQSQVSYGAYKSSRRRRSSGTALPELTHRKESVHKLYKQKIPRVRTAPARRPAVGRSTTFRKKRARVQSARKVDVHAVKESVEKPANFSETNSLPAKHTDHTATTGNVKVFLGKETDEEVQPLTSSEVEDDDTSNTDDIELQSVREEEDEEYTPTHSSTIYISNHKNDIAEPTSFNTCTLAILNYSC